MGMHLVYGMFTRLINYTVTRIGSAATPVGPDAVDQAVGFTLLNSGNSTQDFLLRAEDSTAADPFPPNGPNTFSPTNFRAYVDDGNGTFDAADITADVRTVIDLAPTTSVLVWVVSDMPSVGALNQGDISTVSLVAQVALASTASGFITPEAGGGEAAGTGPTSSILTDHNGIASPGGSFQDAAGTLTVASGIVGTDQVDDPATVQTVFFDTVNGGQQSDINSYAMQVANMTVTKSATAIWDPVNFGVNPKQIPGSYVHYTITITNGAGAGNADLTTLGDTLVAQLTLDPDYINATDAVDPPVVSDSATGESFDLTHFDNLGTADEQNYCTSTTGDTDGCGLVGQAISIDIATVMTNATLAADESLTIEFNAIYNP